MAALSEASTALVLEGMKTAKKHGAVVSFDGNYRPSLWVSRGGRQGSVDVNRSLMPYVDVFFGHEGDVAATLGESSHGPVWHDLESFAAMGERVMKEFPALQVVASSARKPVTASRNHWTGFVYAEGKAHAGLSFDELEVLDRVGGGDAFAAGVVFGLMAARGAKWALDCGVAHGALTMTTPGDSSMATLAEVERLMSGGSAATQR